MTIEDGLVATQLRNGLQRLDGARERLAQLSSPVRGQFDNFMMQYVIFPLPILLAGFILGCSTQQTVSSPSSVSDTSKSIRVYLQDDRFITFSSGEYVIQGVEDSSFIRGAGTYGNTMNSKTSKFEGTVGSAEIRIIQILSPTAGGGVPPPVYILGGLLVLVVYLGTIMVSPH